MESIRNSMGKSIGNPIGMSKGGIHKNFNEKFIGKSLEFQQGNP